MINRFVSLLLLSLLPYFAAKAQNSQLQVLKIKSPLALTQFFAYTGKDVPIISGHRGGMFTGYAENSIAAFEYTLRHTPAFFEIDPRLTKDSVIVLMHDETLERTTTGKGKVGDYTWAELSQLYLKDKDGNVLKDRIPTLEEAIKWSKGKTILNLDKKDVPFEMIDKLLRESKAEAHVMLTVHNAKEAKYYYDRNKKVMFSAFAFNKEAIQAYEDAGIPWSHMIAYVGSKYKPETKELIDLLHARGVMCMISAAPTYDKLADPAARQKEYREIIQFGADIIESDLPVEAAAAIEPLLPAKSSKSLFFKRKK